MEATVKQTVEQLVKLCGENAEKANVGIMPNPSVGAPVLYRLQIEGTEANGWADTIVYLTDDAYGTKTLKVKMPDQAEVVINKLDTDDEDVKRALALLAIIDEKAM